MRLGRSSRTGPQPKPPAAYATASKTVNCDYHAWSDNGSEWPYQAFQPKDQPPPNPQPGTMQPAIRAQLQTLPGRSAANAPSPLSYKRSQPAQPQTLLAR